MAQNYTKGVPMGNNNVGMTGQVAPYPATRTYNSENAAVSSVLTLTSMATAIEIAAVGGPAVMKWITTGDTIGSVVSSVTGTGSANYDHVIPTGAFRRFVVPIETNPNTFNSTGALGPNPANGLYQRVAVKSIGTASVLLTEY